MEALLLIDLQNDFMPSGALAVRNGHHAVHAANIASKLFNIVIASKDWHPKQHLSFASMHEGKSVGENIMLHGLNQTLWPDHCVQNTYGSAFVKSLDQSKIEFVVSKGEDHKTDSYSAFYDNAHRHETALRTYLELKQIDEIYILGVATEYCVRYSALDAISLGIKTNVLIDGCAGINIKKNDIEKAKDEMLDSNIRLITLNGLKEERQSFRVSL